MVDRSKAADIPREQTVGRQSTRTAKYSGRFWLRVEPGGGEGGESGVHKLREASKQEREEKGREKAEEGSTNMYVHNPRE